MLTRREHTEFSQMEFNFCVLHLKSNGHVCYIGRGTNQILQNTHTRAQARVRANARTQIACVLVFVVEAV